MQFSIDKNAQGSKMLQTHTILSSLSAEIAVRVLGPWMPAVCKMDST